MWLSISVLTFFIISMAAAAVVGICKSMTMPAA